MTRHAVLVGLLGLSWAAGCREEPGRGELGQGNFRYVCVNDADAFCARDDDSGAFFDDLDAELPAAVGVGGRFEMLFRADDSASDTVHPASARFVREEAGGFVAVGPGIVAMLARDPVDDHVVDFIHMVVAEPRGLRMDVRGPFDGVSDDLRPGGTAELKAVPVSATGVLLAGARERYRWSTSDDSVIRLQGDPEGVVASVTALARGTAEITAQSGELTASMTLTVRPKDGGEVSIDSGPMSIDGGPIPIDGGDVTRDDDGGEASEDADGGH